MRFCWHKFTKWSEPAELRAISVDTLTGDKNRVHAALQQRYCIKCNLYQRRWVRDR